MHHEPLSLPSKVVERILTWHENRSTRGWRPLSVTSDEATTRWTLLPAGQEIATAGAGRQGSRD